MSLFNTVPPPFYSRNNPAESPTALGILRESHRRKISSIQIRCIRQTHRINCLLERIASLKNEAPHFPVLVPFTVTHLTSSLSDELNFVKLEQAQKQELLLIEAQFPSQKARIKSLLDEFAFLSENQSASTTSGSSKRKRLIYIDDKPKIKLIPSRDEVNAARLEELLTQGIAEREGGNYVMAHYLFSTAMKEFPESYRPLLEKALLFFSNAEYNPAFDYCEEALRLAPDLPEILELKEQILEKY